jgi:SagB-type dehydrogenase family enzyme
MCYRYFLCIVCLCYLITGEGMAQLPETVITLPMPRTAGEHSLETLLRQRRSVRDYQDAPLSPAAIGQLLWAAQGITHPTGLRTAPSAGALYPLELYVVAGNVNDLAAGVYHYRVDRHGLERVLDGDRRKVLARAALGQAWIREAAAVVVFAAEYERTERKYGQRAGRYVHMEVGHAAENLFLQAEALGLATVVVGAFHDAEVAEVLQLPAGIRPLMLMPVGRPR